MIFKKFETMQLRGNIVDVKTKSIFAGSIDIENGKIIKIEKHDAAYSNYILPGLINAHVHIESSMLSPASFAHVVVKHGTVATVSDPHEIANVLGVEGIDYMIESASTVPLKIFFGAPSCVPATSFETSGATIDALKVEQLLQRKDIWYLSEMMNFPGVIYNDAEVHAKIKASHQHKKPVDGHAPYLTGDGLVSYAKAGISTDHECVDIQEALAKIELGIKVQIREGSAAKNFDALHTLISSHPDMVMLCTDDSHPDDLQKGFINQLVKRALQKGHQFFDVLKAVSSNIISHYQLPVGQLQVGDSADFIIIDNIEDFNILSTYIDGVQVFDGKNTQFDIPIAESINRFDRTPLENIALVHTFKKGQTIKIIEAYDGDLTTGSFGYTIQNDTPNFESDLNADILKIVVLSRYDQSPPQIAYINGFGLKQAAFASSIAHDSHNIVAIGSNDKDLLAAINGLIRQKGGIFFAQNEHQLGLPLEIAGLMSNKAIDEVTQRYEQINQAIKASGSKLYAPLMTAAFMSLLVIPKLKLGDKGLFDVETFSFTSLHMD